MKEATFEEEKDYSEQKQLREEEDKASEDDTANAIENGYKLQMLTGEEGMDQNTQLYDARRM